MHPLHPLQYHSIHSSVCVHSIHSSMGWMEWMQILEWIHFLPTVTHIFLLIFELCGQGGPKWFESGQPNWPLVPASTQKPTTSRKAPYIQSIHFVHFFLSFDHFCSFLAGFRQLLPNFHPLFGHFWLVATGWWICFWLVLIAFGTFACFWMLGGAWWQANNSLLGEAA